MDAPPSPSSPSFHDPTSPTRREITQDLTFEDTPLRSPSSSPASLELSDGAGVGEVKPRAYQVEMVEEAMERNIIVAADTGSGKTHIAVLRIIRELDRIPPHRFIWFLAPTVDLCSQQFDYIQEQISSVQVKFLSGADNVDRWTEKGNWDALLKNVKIVVSTFQILLDALSHGSVLMESLALIIFDEGVLFSIITRRKIIEFILNKLEAHNCVAKHPGAKIMQNFYHPRKAQSLHVPHILGLTASPVMRSNPLSLNQIEETLNAICRTPKKHRAELRHHVNLPVLSQVDYQSLPSDISLKGYTRTIESLAQVFGGLNIAEDPYVRELRKDSSEKSIRKLHKALMSHKTWSQDQIKSIYSTSLKICREMGAYGADWYISEVIAKFTKMVEKNDNYLGIWDVLSAEKLYVANALSKVKITRATSDVPVEILVSDKVTKLIDTIVQEPSMFSGIIFVQTRAEVAVLFHLLSIHPRSRGRFRIGTMVGSSTHVYRARNVGELIDVTSQKHTLSLFKTGVINLVIATSVLEEGIDVPVCNVVVCFQKPSNLKSFVQRRGRARHRESKLILILDPMENKVSDWQQLEMNMKKLYEDEMRKLQEVLVLEDTEEHDSRKLRVESTGAMLDLDNAMAHLYHFCATLPANEYVDLRPDFICSEAGPSTVRARVILPISVNEAVRIAESCTAWKSERNAIKDAAFEAYVALYKAGLVNERLLPLLRHDSVIGELTSSAVEKRASIMNINEQLNPWIDIARAWRISGDIRKSVLTLGDLRIGVYLPVEMPPVASFRVFWDANTEIEVTVGSENLLIETDALSKIAEDTWSILEASFGNRFRIERKQSVVQFSSEDGTRFKDLMGRQLVSEADLVSISSSSSNSGLIRDKMDANVTYQYREWLAGKPAVDTVQNPYQNYNDVSKNIPHLSLTRVPRRYDFLHRIARADSTSEKPYSAVLPTSSCTIDDLPFRYVQFGRLIPSIMRRLEISLIAEKLSTTILNAVAITDLSLIVTAISASSANEDSDYQRLEFFGDSILKMCTSVQLMAEFPLWHEGYLSKKKDLLVSNSRLSRAALEIGLDRFIITKTFTGQKWRPEYVDDLLVAPTKQKRDMSSKVLADVVEALIGAAMVDGGIPKALACLQVFLPELHWEALEARRALLFRRPPDVELPEALQLLERLIGYSFNRKGLLIESMTHVSCPTGSGTLERFEFLGDSILDNIVVTAMYGQEKELSHFQMHLLRTALVNADFLAFICMEWKTKQERVDLVEIRTAAEPTSRLKEMISTIAWPLWRFMKHTSPKLGAHQVETAKRHAEVRAGILDSMKSGSHYPWALLARLQAPKFYSDIVESLLGAIWIDSGSFIVCQEVVERMGILPYMRRILRDNVQVWHPKEEVGVLADTETVKYVIERRRDPAEDVEGMEYLCKVYVGDVEIVQVGGGVSKGEVKVKAAEMAVRILKSRKADGVDNKEAITIDATDIASQSGEISADVDTMMEMSM